MRFLFLPAYFILFLLLFRSWILNFETNILGNPDNDGSLTIWIVFWPFLKLKSLFTGEIISPYLNSNIFSGFERGYSFSEMMPGLLPLVVISNLFSDNFIFSINCIQFLMIILLPITNYSLLVFLKINRIPAFISALVCSLTFFHIHNFLHLQLQLAFVIPLGIQFLLQFLETKKIKFLILLFFCWTFLASTSTHIFLYFTLISTILLAVYLYYVLRQKSIPKIKENILAFPIFKSFLVTIFFIIIVLFILYPYFQNISEFHLKRTKVETLLFALSPSDWKKIGLDPILIFFALSIFIFIILNWVKRNSFSERLNSFDFIKIGNEKISTFKVSFFLSLLFLFFSFGPKPFYPYNLLYDYFPGFSGIRDVSRILYCFWIFYSIVLGIIIQVTFHFTFHKKWIDSLLKVILISFVLIEGFLITKRLPETYQLNPPSGLIKIHNEYAKEFKQPLLIVSKTQLFIDSFTIDSYSQYLSLFHKKDLLGGYSGYYPNSIYMLRFALSSHREKKNIWKEEEIQAIINSSPANSVAYLNEDNSQSTIYSIVRNSERSVPRCDNELKGSWRTLEQISPRYGLIIGYTPNSEFCIGKYNTISDRKLKVIWKINDKIIYTDDLYFTTPFYFHPNAPELLYSVEGFRKIGNYDLEIQEEGQTLYTGKVMVK